MKTITGNEDKSIIKITLLDGTTHEYLYQNKSIYFATVNTEGTIEKKVEVCKLVNNAEFTCNNRTINIKVNIGNFEFQNEFNSI